jgi:hypothetical protein
MPVVELERRLPSREASEWEAYFRLCSSTEPDYEPHTLDDVFTQLMELKRR